MFYSPRYSAVFFLLCVGLSLSGYLLGRCVRMASGHPAPHCPVSGTFAAGVLLSSPRCPVRASFASAFSFFVCPFPGIECRLFFLLFPGIEYRPSFRPLCGIPRFSFFCSLVSRSPAIFLVVASGWHPDIPPLGVLCPRVLISLRSNDFFRERVLPSSFVHCAGCYPAFLSSIPPFDGSRWSSLSRVV